MVHIQDPAHKAFMDQWLTQMASNQGSRVPGPEAAKMGSAGGPGGPRPGFQSHPKSSKPGRVPDVGEAFARKGGPPS